MTRKMPPRSFPCAQQAPSRFVSSIAHDKLAKDMPAMAQSALSFWLTQHHIMQAGDTALGGDGDASVAAAHYSQRISPDALRSVPVQTPTISVPVVHRVGLASARRLPRHTPGCGHALPVSPSLQVRWCPLGSSPVEGWGAGWLGQPCQCTKSGGGSEASSSRYGVLRVWGGPGQCKHSHTHTVTHTHTITQTWSRTRSTRTVTRTHSAHDHTRSHRHGHAHGHTHTAHTRSQTLYIHGHTHSTRAVTYTHGHTCRAYTVTHARGHTHAHAWSHMPCIHGHTQRAKCHTRSAHGRTGRRDGSAAQCTPPGGSGARPRWERSIQSRGTSAHAEPCCSVHSPKGHQANDRAEPCCSVHNLTGHQAK